MEKNPQSISFADFPFYHRFLPSSRNIEFFDRQYGRH